MTWLTCFCTLRRSSEICFSCATLACRCCLTRVLAARDDDCCCRFRLACFWSFKPRFLSELVEFNYCTLAF